MKNIKIYIIAALMMAFMFSVNAEAKWWIFGQSNEEVSINYMYLNKISYDESGPAVTLYKETLPDGMIVINGKASVKKGKIGGVRVTTNNKEKWEEAKFSDNGAFEYSFRPEQDKEYVLYVEVMDTSGKTNDIESTRKEVSISDQDITALIRETLDKMIEAYRNENAALFMSFVSENFAGDASNLDSAIRKDFTAFDNIDLRYTLNNVASAANGMIYVSLNFNRSVTSARDGKNYTDMGITELVFQLGSIKVYSMKNPLIFGLSDPEEVATGTVNSSLNKNNIGLAENGEVMLCDNGLCEGGSGTVEAGTITLLDTCTGFNCVYSGYIFADAAVIQEAGWPRTGDINSETNIIFPGDGVGMIDLGVTSIETVHSVPDSGYDNQGFGDEGHCYALKLADGKYAVVEIISRTEITPTSWRTVVKFKYQTDGSRNF